MANLTSIQAQSLIDNNKVYKREIDSEFDCYHFMGRLDGYNYYAVETDTNTLAEDADDATVDAHFKALLEAMEYKGIKGTKTDNKVE